MGKAWTRQFRVTATVAVLSLGLAACGASSDATGPVQLHPRGDLRDVRPVPWERYESTEDDALDVFFLSGVPDCWGLSRVDVAENSDVVEVTVLIGIPTAPSQDDCIDVGISAYTAVRLAQPLGSRSVIDGYRESRYGEETGG